MAYKKKSKSATQSKEKTSVTPSLETSKSKGANTKASTQKAPTAGKKGASNKNSGEEKSNKSNELTEKFIEDQVKSKVKGSVRVEPLSNKTQAPEAEKEQAQNGAENYYDIEDNDPDEGDPQRSKPATFYSVSTSSGGWNNSLQGLLGDDFESGKQQGPHHETRRLNQFDQAMLNQSELQERELLDILNKQFRDLDLENLALIEEAFIANIDGTAFVNEVFNE